jgi:hypothetical protein
MTAYLMTFFIFWVHGGKNGKSSESLVYQRQKNGLLGDIVNFVWQQITNTTT